MSSKISADISYVNADVEIVLEYDSKNREFYFSVPLADSHEFAIVKPALSDVFALLDVAAVHPLKSPSDSVTVSDTAYRAITKAIADGFALDDSTLIDKDFVGTKGNVATMSDIIGLLYEHPVADSYSMSDEVVQVWDYVRNLTDAVVLTDTEVNPLGTLILNTSPLNASNSQFEVYKGNDQVDFFGISDTTALTQGKNFTDALTFSDTDNYSLGKGASESIGCTDSIFLSLANYTDSLSLSEVLADHFSKNSSDTAIVSDSINLIQVSGGVLNATGVPLNSVRLNAAMQGRTLVANDDLPLTEMLSLLLNGNDTTNIVNNVTTVSDSINLAKISGRVLNAAGVPLNNVTLN